MKLCKQKVEPENAVWIEQWKLPLYKIKKAVMIVFLLTLEMITYCQFQPWNHSHFSMIHR